MDFSLSPEHKRIQALSQELAADFEMRTAVHDRDASAPRENYAALQRAGLFGFFGHALRARRWPRVVRPQRLPLICTPRLWVLSSMIPLLRQR